MPALLYVIQGARSFQGVKHGIIHDSHFVRVAAISIQEQVFFYSADSLLRERTHWSCYQAAQKPHTHTVCILRQEDSTLK